jgi:hypothetical protein
VFRKIKPERTKGNPVLISPSKSTEQGLLDAISDRLNCSIEDINIQYYNNGYLINLISTIPSVKDTNIYFPGESYRILKKVSPRAVSKIAKNSKNQSPNSYPIYIQAILREGPEKEHTQLIGDDCTKPDY